MLAVVVTNSGIGWASADPWEIRGAGVCRCRPAARRAAILRLLRREKPTAIVRADRRFSCVVTGAARLAKLPVLEAALPVLAETIASDLYPELHEIGRASCRERV